jgi:serine/threonine-protein kinase
MAPEQLEGKEQTVRTDIYSLGLVLYELFTGKKAFEAATFGDLIKLRRSDTTPTSPTSIVKDLDPIIEKIIDRCIQKDLPQRPSSALQVAAAFPGGDPLAAALAAGETPSPEMVAASGETEGLRPVVAWVLLVGVILSVTAAILMSAQTMLYRRVPLEKPPEALAERARDILQSAGYFEPPVDTAMGFYEGKEFLRYVAEHDQSKTRWDLETGAFVFWYRGSPRPLAAYSSFFFSNAPMLGSVWTDDPPLDKSGMTLVQLNPLGRLTQFIAVPPQVDKPAGAAPSPDWAPLFSAAGFDPSKWTPSQPMWTPPVSSDARAAWTGSLAERPDLAMRIEAAAYRGKPVYFELIGPWTRPERMQPYQPTRGERAVSVIFIVLFLSVLVVSAMLARRNLRLGRGDRRGASRLGAFVLAAWAVAWFFGAHHVPNFAEFPLFIEFLAWGLIWSCFLWVLYIALEPYVRRRWPATLVSWSRLLAGGFRDPLVGRDVLVGGLLAAFSIALGRLGWFVPSWLGYAPPQPSSGPQWQFLGARTIISDISFNLGPVLLIPLAILFVLFLLRALLRKEWAAATAFVLLFTVLFTAGSQFDPVVLVTSLIFWVLAVFVLIRFGLLAFAVQGLFNILLETYPLTTQGSAWYAGISLAGILLMAAMAFYGFYISLAGQPLFGGKFLED